MQPILATGHDGFLQSGDLRWEFQVEMQMIRIARTKFFGELVLSLRYHGHFCDEGDFETRMRMKSS